MGRWKKLSRIPSEGAVTPSFTQELQRVALKKKDNTCFQKKEYINHYYEFSSTCLLIIKLMDQIYPLSPIAYIYYHKF